MILSALADYYQRLLDDPTSGIAAPGYSQEKIGYAIVLTADGSIVDVEDEHDYDGKKRIAKALSVPQPEKRTVAVKSNFLWDKTSYALGVSGSSKRSEQEHAAFKALHQQALAGSDDPGLLALLAFIDTWSPTQFPEHPHFAQHGEALLDSNMVFRLDGDTGYLHQRAAARTAWERQQGQGADGASGICLVSGERAPLARLHPAIKGVNGAQSSGASIVSFNLDAFTSYGKCQGENAPISEQAAFAYTTALNHLLRRDPRNRQRVQIGDATVVFWAQAKTTAQADGAEDLIADFLRGGEADDPGIADGQATQRLQLALEQVRQARPLREVDATLDDEARIFVLGLAPNASRLSIRFWETQTLAGFARRLADHYHDLALQPPAWKRPPMPQFLALQTAPVYGEHGKPKAEDVSPLLAGELTRAILAGTRYPRSLLGAIVMRFRADGQLNPLRVALCRAVLARDARLDTQQGLSSTKGEPPVSLDTANTDPGYLLGRLFSSLENLQRAALGSQINATIRDRYYGAASATPASIFPVLLRSAQNHFGKLRKDKAGLAVNLEKEIGQIIDALPTSFPRTLPIEEQGRFAIGYYHQTQARFVRNDGKDAPDTASEGENA
ncbi:type I-C CRISPR-associated protein Cas8c/Csd1 [Xanthomonas translucens]|uniref:Type I-C CRISPR-associated protein Cas8c/Csd1 n=3 Tax=Xanthomonas campestris pv. translucens TaxID=343 RepID=A0A120EW77_XANCT|nr:type I-C CRISPR-associated protein Cas8c/Csd1 [Xanthomonas translucens]KWV12407.1 type I-C CRISPR-associated protein Cas8c/Csd1 [Xanthomonas translucens]MCC8445235.1 type I-C CRISPR-associated protein Cas8c/Csd1 [Xanthomonas translucens pv. translucens]MCT8285531.1 type I-C CRISPR-associated protein Cas8c/Csd1 [Xanthomonas translucens pv. translucens]MCT8303189.1 type I-C CRISPR-associated protein Cas8c/Csd1 [Xanthomonas translucens pv. translucens]QSQ30416.1 type I-C CRISPR-associated prot